jgi:phosphoribosylformylglycinamidine cyclo-ligase
VAISSDGIGTKAELAERTGAYDSLGFDLVAMVVDDLAAVGCEPVALSNVLDVDRPDPAVVDRLMSGLHDAATQARVVVTGGEIAELGGRVSGFGNGMRFNWSATGLGVFADGTSPIDGRSIEADDAVLSLRSGGFRCNGFTRIRGVLSDAYGEAWHEERRSDGTPWGTALLTPSLIYAPALRQIAEAGIRPTGVAHITGGGIPGNLARVLRACGLGANLEDLFAPHPMMCEVQDLGSIDDAEVYRRWNMGNGMLLVVRPGDVDTTLQSIAAAGYEAKRVGEIVREPAISLRPWGPGASRLEFPVQPAERR